MIFRRYGTFTGGIDLPDEKQSTLEEAIRPCPRPSRLLVPLAPCGGRAARMLVEEHAHVTAGQKLAEAADDSGVDIHAPLEGRVGAVVQAELALRGGCAMGPAVEIVAVEAPAPVRPLTPVFDWRSMAAEELRQRLIQGGLMSCHPRPEPMAGWVERARRKKCRLLIANAVESQPYVTADHRLLAEHGADVIRGLAILAGALEAREAILAVDQRRTDSYRNLVGPARACRISTVALPPKYPVGDDTMLVKVLARRETPLDGESLDVRAAVTDASTCFAVYRWAACDSPFTHRVVTVAGDQAAAPGNYWTPLGSPCLELARAAQPPVIHNGPMVGQRCTDATVVGAGSDCVVAIHSPVPAAATPCIRCGWCTDHCPVRLNVAALNDAFELAQVTRARRLGVTACIGCGVCSYICPARLPLSQRSKQLKLAVQSLRKRMPLLAAGGGK